MDTNTMNGCNYLISYGPQGANQPYSLDGSSTNTVDGYIDYTAAFRPKMIHAGGKIWRDTTDSEWRPYLMYIWPNTQVQLNYLLYFTAEGYSNNQVNYCLLVDLLNCNLEQSVNLLNQYSIYMRDAIEAKIAAGDTNYWNVMSAFVATQPEFNFISEMPVDWISSGSDSGTIGDDQFLFINNDAYDDIPGNTSNADSNFRYVSDTILGYEYYEAMSAVLKNGVFANIRQPEFLVGNDIDNSNPIVQAENYNWEYFLLNYGNAVDGVISQSNVSTPPIDAYDGFRIDAADNFEVDALLQISHLMDAVYKVSTSEAIANNKLLYIESYTTMAQQQLSEENKYPWLLYDAFLFFTFSRLNTPMCSRFSQGSISDLATGSLVYRITDESDGWATPNWSFVNNHDQQKNRINNLIIDLHPYETDSMGGGYDELNNTQMEQMLNVATTEYFNDIISTNKQYAFYNIPACYALLLTNKDTVPCVYYGDMFNEFKPYMTENSIYFEPISTLLMNRSKYVAGGQAMDDPSLENNFGNNTVVSIRYGLGVYSRTTMPSPLNPLARNSGCAVIVNNNPNEVLRTIVINMGIVHANQKYMSIIDTTPCGLSYVPQYLTTDSQGNLSVKVQGFSNPLVTGYLSVWVPANADSSQNVMTPDSTSPHASGNIYESNSALDKHVIFEAFSLYQPTTATGESTAYQMLASNAGLLSSLNITDIWMPPGYEPFSESRYLEGYSVADRYNLDASKYGNSTELRQALTAIHNNGMRAQADLVLNQMIGYPVQEAVTVDRVNAWGNPFTTDCSTGITVAGEIYFAYTKSDSNNLQETYGGAYLDLLSSNFPILFNTPSVVTGDNVISNVPITQWRAEYQNGTSIQNIGVGRAVKVGDEYAYINSGDNNYLTTLLPDELQPDYVNFIISLDPKCNKVKKCPPFTINDQKCIKNTSALICPYIDANCDEGTTPPPTGENTNTPNCCEIKPLIQDRKVYCYQSCVPVNKLKVLGCITDYNNKKVKFIKYLSCGQFDEFILQYAVVELQNGRKVVIDAQALYFGFKIESAHSFNNGEELGIIKKLCDLEKLSKKVLGVSTVAPLGSTAYTASFSATCLANRIFVYRKQVVSTKGDTFYLIQFVDDATQTPYWVNSAVTTLLTPYTFSETLPIFVKECCVSKVVEIYPNTCSQCMNNCPLPSSCGITVNNLTNGIDNDAGVQLRFPSILVNTTTVTLTRILCFSDGSKYYGFTLGELDANGNLIEEGYITPDCIITDISDLPECC